MDGDATGLPGYRLAEFLGSGSTARVRVGYHVKSGEKVAVKVLDKTKTSSQDLHRVYREVRILALLDHPYIVRMYDMIETGDQLYLIMEFCGGGEVYDYLCMHGAFTEERARHLFRQLVDAMHFCHGLSIVHRDLKLENLLFGENLEIRICDFGLGNICEGENAQFLRTLCGTPNYVAPELLNGEGLEGYNGQAVDTWSLGCILYALVVGRLPFASTDLQKLLYSIVVAPIILPAHLSPDLKSLLMAIFERSPEKRITVEEIRVHPWVTAQDGPVPIFDPERNPNPKRLKGLMSASLTRTEIEAAIALINRPPSPSSSDDGEECECSELSQTDEVQLLTEYRALIHAEGHATAQAIETTV